MKAIFTFMILLISISSFAEDQFKFELISKYKKYNYITFYCTYSGTTEKAFGSIASDFSVTIESYKECGISQLGTFSDEESFLNHVLRNFPVTTQSRSEIYGRLQSILSSQ